MKEIAPLLEKLAIALGTTVEKLWQVLIAQAQVQMRIDGIWMNVALYLFGGLALVLFVIWLVGLMRSWDGEGLSFVFGCAALLTVIGVWMYYSNYTEILTLTYNPEYWALQEILKAIR